MGISTIYQLQAVLAATNNATLSVALEIPHSRMILVPVCMAIVIRTHFDDIARLSILLINPIASPQERHGKKALARASISPLDYHISAYHLIKIVHCTLFYTRIAECNGRSCALSCAMRSDVQLNIVNCPGNSYIPCYSGAGTNKNLPLFSTAAFNFFAA